MRSHRVILGWLLFALTPAVLQAQESYKVETIKNAPPSQVAEPVRSELKGEGIRILDGSGKPYAEIWLRKAIPASEKPSGPKGAVQFPFLAEGELLGALRFPGKGHDYRDQTINAGVYTIRYGLQPVNGDHLGVSTYRDYWLLIPAGKDVSLANITAKPLHEKSSESAGSSHPAVLLLLTPPDFSAPFSMIRDEEKNTWSAVIPLDLKIKGASSVSPFKVQLIIIGAAAA